MADTEKNQENTTPENKNTAATPKKAAPRKKTSPRKKAETTTKAAQDKAPKAEAVTAANDAPVATAPDAPAEEKTAPAKNAAKRSGNGKRPSSAKSGSSSSKKSASGKKPAPQKAATAAPSAPAESDAQAAPQAEAAPQPKEARQQKPASKQKSRPKASPKENNSAKTSAPVAPADKDEVANKETNSAPAETAAATVTTAEENAAPTTAQPASEQNGTSGQGKQKSSRRSGRNRKKPAAKKAAAPKPDEQDAAPASEEAQQPANETGQKAEAKAAPQKGAAKQQEKSSNKGGKAKHRMFFSMLGGEQIEVALAHEGQLVEYYLDMLHQQKMKGNIYKGVIHNIDTNLQAAFVDFGVGKNGFLQIDEVHPEYWQAHHEPAKGKKFPPIQKVLKAGQELLVQVVKEPTGNKGAFLTTWLSLAGRFLVLTPGQEQLGVSRKVEDEAERNRLKELITGIDPGSGMGVIVRTASAGTTKTNLKNDLQYLKRLWRDIRKKGTEVSAPTLVHKEPGLAERAVRDYLTDEVGEIWVDNHALATTVREMTELLFPRKQNLVHEHSDARLALWDRFNLRRQIEQIHSREVTLPSGGRLVFDQTEALMAIDINSGKISGKGNFEAMAHKTNKEAAEAIASQLRLRDVGGQVVIDFIEMRENKHVQDVEKALRQAMKNDRARHEINHMSSFGLLELVRQRTGSSAISITLEPCPHCGGTGQRRNMEWQALQAAGEIRRQLQACKQERLVFQAEQELAMYLLNRKRAMLKDLETEYGKGIDIAVKV